MATVQEESRDGLHALAELSGTVLEERYELGRVLGAGAMGAVFHRLVAAFARNLGGPEGLQGDVHPHRTLR